MLTSQRIETKGTKTRANNNVNNAEPCPSRILMAMAMLSVGRSDAKPKRSPAERPPLPPCAPSPPLPLAVNVRGDTSIEPRQPLDRVHWRKPDLDPGPRRLRAALG